MAKKEDAAAAAAKTGKDPPLEVSSGAAGSSNEEGKSEAPPKPKTPAKFAFHAIKIFDALAILFALFIIVVARFFRPGFWSTLLYALAGLPAGVAMSFLYFKRKREKRSRRQLVCPCTVIAHCCISLPRKYVSSLTHPMRCPANQPACPNVQYNIEPGAKGVTELLQKIPTWLTLSDVEKCEV